jgi:hypothetical protein
VLPLRAPRHVLIAAVLTAACGPSGSAPRLEPVADQVVAVNQELVLVLAGADRDGDELDYSFTTDLPDIDGRAAITALPVGAGEFRWIPLAADVGVWNFTFTVSDGSYEDTITTRIDVRSAIGDSSAPHFLHPQGMGTTLDLEKASCVELDIEIADSDSTEVELAQLEPLIEGAELDQTDGLRATWTWCPTSEQIEADDRYSVVLAADDGENPRTIHSYLIVLRRPTKPDCPGDPPTITHEPRDRTTLAAVAVTAQIADPEGLKSEPLLYYSEAQPSDPPDLAQMTQLTMRLTEGSMKSGTWRASIPNPVAGDEAGATRSLHYVIAATDDDDPEGSCDHLTQAPATGSFSMVVTNPGGDGGGELCEPCTADVQCGAANDHCVRVGSAAEAFCLAACDEPSDCPEDFTCSEDPVTSVDGASARQCVPVSSDCADPGGSVCEDDPREDNDTPAQAATKPRLPAGTHDLISCPASAGTGDDEDWFEIQVVVEGRVTIELEGTDASDLDLALLERDGTLLDASQTFTSSEEVSACLPVGTYLIRVFAFGPATNPYALTVRGEPETCEAVCEDDANEPDDSPAQARPTDIFPGPFRSNDQAICTGDQDWYEIDLFNGERLIVDVTFEQANSQEDLDIHLHDDEGVDLTPCSPEDPQDCSLENGQSADSNEHFEAQAPATGCAPCIFYVVVQGFGESENSYDIAIQARQP